MLVSFFAFLPRLLSASHAGVLAARAIFVISLVIYTLPIVQQLDQRLPDYKPSTASAE